MLKERFEQLGPSAARSFTALADGTTPRRIRYWTKFDLLIIDEFGFDRIERSRSPEASSLLYKIIDARSVRRP